jgi:ATP-dependent exoDNAse (exonuclease V) beta subunit
VRELDEVDDEIDQRALGRLTHQVLERLFRRFADEAMFPLRGAEAELELADEVCDDVIAEWRRTEPLGHPALFAVKERQLRQEVAALLKAEIDRPPSEGCRPAHFERAFGPLAVGEVWLKGKIDRIDVGGARAVVLDYKTGRLKSYAEHLKDEAVCVTGWQLPMYAVAVRAELGHAEVEARFYSLKDAQTTKAVGAPPDFADRLGAVYAAMRDGDFAVRPRPDACERCGMEAACRVRQLKREEDEP